MASNHRLHSKWRLASSVNCALFKGRVKLIGASFRLVAPPVLFDGAGLQQADREADPIATSKHRQSLKATGRCTPSKKRNGCKRAFPEVVDLIAGAQIIRCLDSRTAVNQSPYVEHTMPVDASGQKSKETSSSRTPSPWHYTGNLTSLTSFFSLVPIIPIHLGPVFCRLTTILEVPSKDS